LNQFQALGPAAVSVYKEDIACCILVSDVIKRANHLGRIFS